MSDIREHNATPRAELERQIMDPNIPKNEREWWAAAEIERLTANCKGWYDQNVNLIEQRDKVWEENKSLRADQERDEAEIGRLTQQNADLRRWKALGKPLTAAMSIVVTDMQELRTEIERLRAALDRAADALEFYDNKAEAQKARRVLETK